MGKEDFLLREKGKEKGKSKGKGKAKNREDPIDGPRQWQLLAPLDGPAYYNNQQTGESRWTPPEGWAEAKAQAEWTTKGKGKGKSKGKMGGRSNEGNQWKSHPSKLCFPGDLYGLQLSERRSLWLSRFAQHS